MLIDILARHRGPYTLQVCRPNEKAPGTFHAQLLPQQYEPEDVLDAARKLLGDLHDTVTAVTVWSEAEQMFVTTLTPMDCD